MVRKLIEWAVGGPLIVLLLAIALAAVGTHAFRNVNVEAYPDPAPAIIEVVAQYPGSSAEEVERLVTIPLEIAVAGMPGLKYTRSKSLAGLCHLRNQFDYGIDFYKARQEVINRLQFVSGLPAGVNPQISPATPTGEIFRYTLKSPKDALGRGIYSLWDLKSLQDWTLEREFRRIPRISDVTSAGGAVKRYEIHPDPDRLKRYGITLQQLQDAVAKSNGNVGGDYLKQGGIVHNVRFVGLIGNGQDPMVQVQGLSPERAAAALRAEEQFRLHELRRVVVASVNSIPVHVEDLVDGGPIAPDMESRRGVVVGQQTRLGKTAITKPLQDEAGHEVVDARGKVVWETDYDTVQGIVLLRKNEESLPALRDVEAKVKELNDSPGRLLPGVRIEPYYDRTELIGITTETVQENLIVGMLLVSVILLMFLGNVRCAVIVALNIPLALLFAFGVLYARGKSANLLSIGAVDFGIIVDSTVIIVENIYRHLNSGENRELSLKDRIVHASGEVERSLFFSTIIMVCALLPLFTMQGPEGQIFGPMADTYAFALGGALILALTLSPVLCLLLFGARITRLVKGMNRMAVGTISLLLPGGLLAGLQVVGRWLWGGNGEDNVLVRAIRAAYLWQLSLCLRFQLITLCVTGAVIIGTFAFVVPNMGREFMPELEEGNLWIRATFPLNISLDLVAAKVANPELGRKFGPPERAGRAGGDSRLTDILSVIRRYEEIESAVAQMGRPDDGTDPTGFYNVEFFVPLKPQKRWPMVKEQVDPQSGVASMRARTKEELIDEMNAELNRTFIGVDWNFSQNIRDNVMESLSGVKGDNSVKIFGPDLDRLELIAEEVKQTLESVQGIENVGVFHIQGQSNFEMRVDRSKCERFNVSVADAQNVVDTAIRGKAFTAMIEGEKTFDVSLRLPERLRGSVEDLLKVPVDVTNNVVVASSGLGVSATGSSQSVPSSIGTSTGATLNLNLINSPRRLLGDLVSPLGKNGRPDPLSTDFIRPGASTISREQGRRLIAVKFSVRGRDLGSAVAEAQQKVTLEPPYQAEWSGEFQEMEEAEQRLLKVVCLSLAGIVVLLYLAFGSLLDAVTVFANVTAMAVGGVWALVLTGLNFNISAAVGFISILGVAIMNGLLMVSSFNRLRGQGQALRPALMSGVGHLVRPVTMTALAAIFGLLPAAMSTRIGAQSQRPLAIVVVGGMITTLIMLNFVPVIYSLYGRRTPSGHGGGLGH